MVMAEALWAELHDQGVDVLGLVLGLTDTPALRRLLVQRGELADSTTPLPGATPAEVVAADAIANLANGPTWLAGEDVRMGFEHLGAMPRNDAVRLMISGRRRARWDRRTQGDDAVTTPRSTPMPAWRSPTSSSATPPASTGRDWDLFRTCFTADCHADYGDIGVWRGIDELTAWMGRPTRRRAHAAPHHQPGRRRHEGGATARCYVDAIVMGADNQAGVRAVGFYDDELIHTDQGWQIHRRRFTPAIFRGHRPRPTTEGARPCGQSCCEADGSRSARPPIRFPVPASCSCGR